MEVREIKHNNQVLARHIPSESWSEGLGFYSMDDEFVQVGSWQYNQGKELLKHIHNQVERSVDRTQEVLYIKRGSIKAKIYTLDEVFVEELIVKQGDTLILLNSGHGYEILEDGTQVLEIKNGPYLGAERDRRRF
ncbi:MAG: hypothetical protein A2X18_06290 [Bacteroidetes bacterium GWF2_40_14]|nr:MAG: hypothetical protein A2X18_06290 [Bacteroidetes bacterium GWF2_40_14]